MSNPASPRTRVRSGARSVFALVAILLLSALVPQAALATEVDPANPIAPAPPTYSFDFVSAPDFLNADIGDVSRTRNYRPGSPNSTNASWDRAVNGTVDIIAAEPGDDVLVAGDLVEGRWGMDTLGTKTFGKVTTYKKRAQAARRAGNLYYGAWLRRFTRRGLTTYPAVGDHEVGDNPWWRKARKPGGKFNPISFRWKNFHERKRTFSRKLLQSGGRHKFGDRPSGPAAGTAYATRLHPEVQLVTLDVFRRAPITVKAELDRRQLAWLHGVLSRANADGVDWIIVQGHTPIVGPVRQRASSGIYYKDGVQSSLWKLMSHHGVDLYLNGEVHDVTAHQPVPGGPVQISHGGLLVHGGANFASVTLNDHSATIKMQSVPCTRSRITATSKLWQTDTRKKLPEIIDCDPAPSSLGSMTVTSDREVTERTGKLGVFVAGRRLQRTRQ